MRYQNWDVLLFPEEYRIPLQEFKTNCQVIQDSEALALQNSSVILPAVTCFIPGLQAGAPFRVSIHSWQNPEVSRHVQSLSKPGDLVIFEARLFIDGQIAGSKWFNQDGPWPSIIELGTNLDKEGNCEKLKFPTFHKELLSQSYWRAADDHGRIRVTISEGFSRTNTIYPFERVRNVVSFMFQHAPLDVLETSCIAWPNAAMWRQVPLIAPCYTQQISPRIESGAAEDHSHSPRRRSTSISSFGSMLPPSMPGAFPRQPTLDPFTEPVHAALKPWRQASSNLPMPDVSKSNTQTNSSRQITDPMLLCERPELKPDERSERKLESMESVGALASIWAALEPPAPANTPQTAQDTSSISSSRRESTKIEAQFIPVKPNAADELHHSMQPLGPVTNIVKSRKENIQDTPQGDSHFGINEGVVRKVAQPFATTTSGSKRQRVITPAATKVIDAEDEPRTSPLVRKVSRGSLLQENENERSAFKELENV